MEQLLFYIQPTENTGDKRSKRNTVPLTESQKKFYSQRYLRRKIEKFYEVRVKKKIIYEDSDVILTKTRQRQVNKLVTEHGFTIEPTPQTKIFNK